MPTYEYSCKKCGERFDVLQSFSDKPLKTHAGCGGDLKKVFHARGIVFKGSGFYANDHRSSASPTKSSTSSEKKTSTSSEKKTSTSSEKKEAAKAASGSSDD